MKIALVHDYFTQLGGAEKVAEELYRLVPSATVFATVATKEGTPQSFAGVPLRTSWMQRLPKMDRYYRLYFLLYPLGVSSLDLTGYDLVISSSSSYVKGIKVPPHALHVCYCHTPMRWVWNFDGYSSREKMGKALQTLTAFLIGGLRRWDSGASRQPDHYVANSRVVADRIKRAYGREAEVIHPPIETHRFQYCEPGDDGYYLVLSRLVSYKRLDLAVEACTRLKRRLVVVGGGPQAKELAEKAGDCVTFAGRVSDTEVVRLASRCRALIFPGEEDFGMAPLEVAAAGRPTIAFHAGGSIETVTEGSTGCFFHEQTAESLMACIERFETLHWNSDTLRSHAQQFSVEVFRERFLRFLARVGADLSPADLLPATRDVSLASTAGLLDEVGV